MARLVKFVLVLIAAIVGIGVVASVALLVFFDPNDFRDDISKAVKEATGRDLVIEGDLSLSVFPWIAIGIGRTELGNAEGFGEDAFLAFSEARLSVRVVPLLLRQEIAVGTASLDGLTVNLAVDGRGRTNWDDLGNADDRADPQPEEPAESGGAAFNFDIANIEVSDANIRYADNQAGSTATVGDLSFRTGRIAAGEAFDFAAEFDLDSQPDGVGGRLEISGNMLFSDDFAAIDINGLNIAGDLRGVTPEPTELNFDSRAIHVDTSGQNIDLGELDLGIFGIGMTAKVEPFSYAGDPQPVAELQVREFSLKDLMQTFGTEPPETADPAALQRVSFSAKAAVGKNDIALSDMRLALDDTSMTGSLSLPKQAGGTLRFDLNVDRIVVDHYMAPATEEAAGGAAGEANAEIPADLIRALNADGNFRMQEARLGNIVFTNMQLGLLSKDGQLRLNPMSAEIFGGEYRGDVRIDARTDTPSIAVDENIAGVKLADLAVAMFEVENVNGTIEGRFQLSGAGADVNAIREDLDGSIRFALADGEFIGTDVWYELRNARAMLKQEQPPEPSLPPRTEFTSVLLEGTVTNGVMMTDQILAELPFMRLTGDGAVSFVDATIDARMDAAILDNPELAGQASEAELKDFTAAVIPLTVSGPLSSPSIKPNIEALLRREVERQVEKKTEELKNELLDRLLGGDKPPEEGEEGAEGEETGEEQPEEEPDVEDVLKDALKDIFGS